MFEVLVATLIVENRKILLVKEKKEEAKDLLNLPAGHLEKGESLVSGALRELKEETGLDAKITRFIDNQYFEKNGKNFVAFVFQGEIMKNRKKSANELAFGFYDIEFLKVNKQMLRNEKLIFEAIEKMNTGSESAVDVMK